MVPGNTKWLSTAKADAVSYLPLPPPIWAHIESNPFYPPLPIIYTAPDTIRLSSTLSCHCSVPQQLYNSEQSIY